MADKQITPTPFFGFPQGICDALDREISRINEIVDQELDRCEHQAEERHPGSCDGGEEDCTKQAVVTDIRSGNQFCLHHFEGVICG